MERGGFPSRDWLEFCFLRAISVHFCFSLLFVLVFCFFGFVRMFLLYCQASSMKVMIQKKKKNPVSFRFSCMFICLWQPFLQWWRVKMKRCQQQSFLVVQEFTIFSNLFLWRVWRCAYFSTVFYHMTLKYFCMSSSVVKGAPYGSWDPLCLAWEVRRDPKV